LESSLIPSVPSLPTTNLWRKNVISCLAYSFRNLRSRASYILLYNSHVLSRMLYCSVVWTGSAEYLIKSLEPVHNRFLRYLNWRLSLPKEFSGNELRSRFGMKSRVWKRG
jgi:hypothetical protein